MERRILSTSLIKNMGILETLIEEGEVGVSHLGKMKGINKSNVHRILNTFEFLGYVEKNPENSKYKASLKVFELGSVLIQRIGLNKIVHPFLEELGSKFGETNNLAVFDRNEVVYIDKFESSEALRMDLAIGRRIPAYCSALGKTLLAGLNMDQLGQYFEEVRFVRNTKNTIISKVKLRQHLAQIREQGFAIDDEELDYGIRCIAAPVKNHLGDTVASISMAGPATRMTMEKIDRMKKVIVETAEEISRRLGFRANY